MGIWEVKECDGEHEHNGKEGEGEASNSWGAATRKRTVAVKSGCA